MSSHPKFPQAWLRFPAYRVYRREDSSGAWQLLTPDLVGVAAYHDATVVAAHTYTYRVTAVSTAGNESAPSPEAVETAPTAH
jgi:fibronectin type 3 domain-containing protein